MDATVQGLPAAVHRVPVQQHRHHMPGGRVHHRRCVHVHIHRELARLRENGHRPGGRQPDGHRRPHMGPDVLQRVLRGGLARRGPVAPTVVPEPRHRGRPQL